MEFAEYQRPTEIDQIGTWEDRQPAHHDGDFIWPGRRVALLPDHQWPFPPETCPAGPLDNTWHADGAILLCNYCGLDNT